MEAEEVAGDMLTVWLEEKVPPLGVISGAAAIVAPFSNPYTSTSP